MATTQVLVTGMTRDHCVRAVSQELRSLAGVERVEVDLASGAVSITAAEAPDLDAVAAAIEEAGYEIAAP